MNASAKWKCLWLMGLLVLGQAWTSCSDSSGSSPTDPVYRSYLYSVNSVDNSISTFRINDESGALKPVADGSTPLPAGIESPYGIAVDSERSLVAVVVNTPASLLTYRILSPKTGAISFVDSAPLPPASEPTFVSFHPTRSRIYVSMSQTNNVKTFEFNNTGKLSEISDLTTYPVVPTGAIASATFPHAIVVAPSGKFAFSAHTYGDSPDRIFSYKVDSNDGTLSAVTNTPLMTLTGDRPRNMVVSQSGDRLYVVNEGPPSVGVYAISAGSLTHKQTVPVSIGTSYGGGIAISPDDRFIFATHRFPGGVIGKISTFAIKSDGTLKDVGVSDTGIWPQAITYFQSPKSNARFVYVANAQENTISAFDHQ